MSARRISPTAAVKGATLTEAEIQRGLTQAVRALGGRSYHNLYAVGSDSGYPDMTVVLPDGRIYWFEAKGPRGRVSPDQVEWLERLADHRAFVVWPDVDRANSGLSRWPSVVHATYDEALRLLQGEEYP